jgi:pilus assembly protein CpaF
MAGGERFSPAAYSARLRSADADATAAVERETDAQRDFQRLAEDIRAYLALPRGGTEEERRQYNEKLNRAVLGYAEDREQILALIADRLLRQRIHEIPGFRHPYLSLAEALFAEEI